MDPRDLIDNKVTVQSLRKGIRPEPQWLREQRAREEIKPVIEKRKKELASMQKRSIADLLKVSFDKKDIPKGNVDALVDWAGRVGFEEAAKKLADEKSVKDPKKLAGWLKARAREKGTLSPAHAYGKKHSDGK